MLYVFAEARAEEPNEFWKQKLPECLPYFRSTFPQRRVRRQRYL